MLLEKKWKELGRRPKNARMVTADATSMDTQIETEHGLEVLRRFLEELQEEGKLPPDFDIEMSVETAALVVR